MDKFEEGDFLILEFKILDGKWIEIEKIFGLFNSELLISNFFFEFYVIFVL